MTLSGLKVILGVTGGIAAYKSVILARRLTERGAAVRVVMTEAARQFVGAVSFQAVTGYPVRCALFDANHEAAMGHIELARWADVLMLVPATADFLAKLAQGRADDLLSTLCLATRAPLVVAPAMNRQMWRHPATVHNVAVLEQRGVRIWGPDSGVQACGDSGLGRLLEPEALLARLNEMLSGGPLSGVRVMITAGPTQEPLDPVRFIGNRSSGKMGYALAEVAKRAGAEVLLVSGPVSLDTPFGVRRLDVRTALQMQTAVMEHIADTDLFIACAAVADYRPERVAGQKIKKNSERLELRLVRNPDILAQVAALEDAPFTVGFAAETQRLAEYAEQKRISKAVDMIAANSVAVPAQGFDTENNELLVLWEGGRKQLPLQHKAALAGQLLELIIDRYYAQTGTENTR